VWEQKLCLGRVRLARGLSGSPETAGVNEDLMRRPVCPAEPLPSGGSDQMADRTSDVVRPFVSEAMWFKPARSDIAPSELSQLSCDASIKIALLRSATGLNCRIFGKDTAYRQFRCTD
jgi:hypothetical protein